MNQKTINLLIFLLMVFMMLSLVSQFLSFVLSKNGVACAVLIFAMYQIHSMSRRRTAGGGNYSYYDKINTFSGHSGGGYDARSSEKPRGRGFFASIAGWFGDIYRRYYYRKFNNVWKNVQEKYAGDMFCPVCRSELTVFNITIDGKCGYCKNKLL